MTLAGKGIASFPRNIRPASKTFVFKEPSQKLGNGVVFYMPPATPPGQLCDRLLSVGIKTHKLMSHGIHRKGHVTVPRPVHNYLRARDEIPHAPRLRSEPKLRHLDGRRIPFFGTLSNRLRSASPS